MSRELIFSDAASGWARWALAHPEFGSSVNPIATRGADYAHHITACPPGFENLTASLHLVVGQLPGSHWAVIGKSSGNRRVLS